jgi:serine/threonine-protein kinase
MAAVYKALHIRFQELRALKIINHELAHDFRFVARFTQEAVLTRKLQHLNAVRVDDIDEAEDGRPFIVMEFIAGRNLKEVIKEEAPFKVMRACSIAKQVASALDAAHRLGMVHRDVKPANIVLVGKSGGAALPPAFRPEDVQLALDQELAKVLDFGIAKVKEGHLEDSRFGHLTLTGTGMVVGTPAYMSPEQALGKRGDELDRRSDLYSLGIVTYEMLTGDLPLKVDTTMGLLMAHVHVPPTPILQARPDLQIPDAIASLVMRCLEKNPERRPATAQALIEEIEYWEQEPARIHAALRKAEEESLARQRAEQERFAAERVAVERAEQERVERERVLAEAMARIKAEGEPHDRDGPQAQRAHRYADLDPSAGEAPPRVVAIPRPGASSTGPQREHLDRALWAGLAVAVILLGFTVWYFFVSSGRAPKQPSTESITPEASEGATRPAAGSELGATTPPTGQIEPGTRAEPGKPQAVDKEARQRDIERQVKAWTAQADVTSSGGDYDEAINLYQKVLELDPENPKAREGLDHARRAKAAIESIR